MKYHSKKKNDKVNVRIAHNFSSHIVFTHLQTISDWLMDTSKYYFSDSVDKFLFATIYTFNNNLL